MGFTREAIESVGERWEEIEPHNLTLERLRKRRISTVGPEGARATSKVVWKIDCFVQVALYRLVMLADGCTAAWNVGNPLTAVLCARAIVEATALVLDFEAQLSRFCDRGDFEPIDDLVMNRTFSTRLADWIEQDTGLTAPNILGHIDKLDKKIDGVRRHYEILSEMCHPNYLGHHALFAFLNTRTGILELSERRGISADIFNQIFPPFVTLGLFENSIDRIQALLPKVIQLSNSARAGRSAPD